MEQLKLLAFLKTGRLIQASVVGPVILSGKDKETISKWEIFSSNLGILFQLTDGILDETGDEKKVGKTLHKDNNAGKNTFVSLLGMKKAAEYKDKLLTETIKLLPSGYYLEKLVKFIAERDY